jgi:hypothetical protein
MCGIFVCGKEHSGAHKLGAALHRRPRKSHENISRKTRLFFVRLRISKSDVRDELSAKGPKMRPLMHYGEGPINFEIFRYHVNLRYYFRPLPNAQG